MKPDLTYEIKNYAMKQAQRLKQEYPKGLTSRDLSKELNCTPLNARKAMNKRGFTQVYKRYSVCDVAALLAFRYWYRKRQIKARTI